MIEEELFSISGGASINTTLVNTVIRFITTALVESIVDPIIPPICVRFEENPLFFSIHPLT